MPAEDVVTMDKIVALCKRRGFIFPSSEIYGGVGSTYDFGHYGVLLKTNVKNEWWRAMIGERDDIVAIDSAILQSPKVWEASGHLAGFTDPLVDCKACKQRFRADHLDPDEICPAKANLPKTEDRRHEYTEARDFNLMFKTNIGPVEETASVAYLRPETAQGIFINFKNYLQFARKKPPFGIAQVGKSFRNEISPRNFIFRTREFEQMEMEFFVPPDEAPKWYEYWKQQRRQWYVDLGIRPDHLVMREHDPDELSHYSSGTADVEYEFPGFGVSELEGIANRGNFDLTQHAQHSGEKLEYFDTASGERYVPHVIEPAAGADRATLAFMVDAYDEEEVNGEQRTVLKLHPRLAPVKVAVFPLVKKDGQPELAREIFSAVRKVAFAEYDEGGAIGKRYRRQDEIGTPWCITVDHDSLTERTVTVLGCGPAWPHAGGATSGFLVDAPTGERLLIDCGHGVSGVLQAHGGPVTLDAIVLTHHHADHSADLPALAHRLRFDPADVASGRRPLLIAGAPCHAGLQGWIDAQGDPTMLSDAFELVTVAGGGATTVGTLALRFADVPHSVPCLAIDVDGGAAGRITFSGDHAGDAPGLPELARGTDLLVTEATESAPSPYHSTAREAGELAAAAGAHQLLVTHFADAYDREWVLEQARSAYDGVSQLASGGLVITT